MVKAELQAKLEAKQGFVSIIKDDVAPDNVSGDVVEKRFFYVNHVNADGTAGKTFVYYLHNTETDEAWFYNVETEAVDTKEPTTEQKKLDALQAYMKANFAAFFVLRFDLENNWAEADVFEVSGTDLAKSSVLVFKLGTNPITHRKIV